MNNVDRTEFEKAAIRAGHDPIWDGDQYLYEDMQTAWEIWQSARQAPASGEVEPVAMQYWWPESPRIKRIAPFDPSLEKQGAIVRPLVYADTHPPAKVPAEYVKQLIKDAHCEGQQSATGREPSPFRWVNSQAYRNAEALLTTPTPATTPEAHKGFGGWIIGRMRDGDCVTCEKCGKAGSVLVDDGGTDIEWFAPPQEQ